MLLSNLNLLATAPGGVARLRELILTLAVQGKLVPQDVTDEPAEKLLRKIRAEKDRLIAEGKIRQDKPLAAIAEGEQPFELPVGWGVGAVRKSCITNNRWCAPHSKIRIRRRSISFGQGFEFWSHQFSGHPIYLQ